MRLTRKIRLTRTRILVAALVATLGVAALLLVIDEPTPTAAQGWLGNPPVDAESGFLADALGISADELANAREEARKAALDAMVDSGRISPEAAEWAKAKKALRDYMDEQGVREEARSLYEKAVEDAARAGVITEEQAERFTERPRWLPGLGGPGRGHKRGWSGKGPCFGDTRDCPRHLGRPHGRHFGWADPADPGGAVTPEEEGRASEGAGIDQSWFPQRHRGTDL